MQEKLIWTILEIDPHLSQKLLKIIFHIFKYLALTILTKL